MHEEPRELAQWTLDVTVFHHRSAGHWIRASVLDRRGGWHTVGAWSWKGSGFPAELLSDVEARVSGVIAEHLVSRYGLNHTLFDPQRDEPDPF